MAAQAGIVFRAVQGSDGVIPLGWDFNKPSWVTRDGPWYLMEVGPGRAAWFSRPTGKRIYANDDYPIIESSGPISPYCTATYDSEAWSGSVLAHSPTQDSHQCKVCSTKLNAKDLEVNPATGRIWGCYKCGGKELISLNPNRLEMKTGVDLASK